MKFLLTKEVSQNPLLRHLIGAVVLFIVLYLGLDILLHGLQLGMTPEAVGYTLRGDIQNYEEPILIETLLLLIHIDLFMTLFALLILSTVSIRLFGERGGNAKIQHLLFLLGLIAPLTLLVSHWGITGMTWVWMVSFLSWHLLALGQSIRIIIKLYLR